jgi:hypothetical protein
MTTEPNYEAHIIKHPRRWSKRPGFIEVVRYDEGAFGVSTFPPEMDVFPLEPGVGLVETLRRSGWEPLEHPTRRFRRVGCVQVKPVRIPPADYLRTQVTS